MFGPALFAAPRLPFEASSSELLVSGLEAPRHEATLNHKRVRQQDRGAQQRNDGYDAECERISAQVEAAYAARRGRPVSAVDVDNDHIGEKHPPTWPDAGLEERYEPYTPFDWETCKTVIRLVLLVVATVAFIAFMRGI